MNDLELHQMDEYHISTLSEGIYATYSREGEAVWNLARDDPEGVGEVELVAAETEVLFHAGVCTVRTYDLQAQLCPIFSSVVVFKATELISLRPAVEGPLS
jgi:hypothetical protein